MGKDEKKYWLKLDLYECDNVIMIWPVCMGSTTVNNNVSQHLWLLTCVWFIEMYLVLCVDEWISANRFLRK